MRVSRSLMSRLDVTLCALGAILFMGVFVIYETPSTHSLRSGIGRATFGGVFVSAKVVDADPEHVPSETVGLIFENRGKALSYWSREKWATSGTNMAAACWINPNESPSHLDLRNLGSEMVDCEIFVMNRGVSWQFTLKVPAERSMTADLRGEKE